MRGESGEVGKNASEIGEIGPGIGPASDRCAGPNILRNVSGDQSVGHRSKDGPMPKTPQIIPQIGPCIGPEVDRWFDRWVDRFASGFPVFPPFDPNFGPFPRGPPKVIWASILGRIKGFHTLYFQHPHMEAL